MLCVLMLCIVWERSLEILHQAKLQAKTIVLQCLPPALPTKAIAWVDRMIDYNVSGGKCLRGAMIVETARKMQPAASPTDLTRAALCGWAVEYLQASFLVADDIMDDSETRRGRPCWYKVEGVNQEAVNDVLILESSVYQLLSNQLRGQTFHLPILELFHSVSFATTIGQLLDVSAPFQQNWSEYTSEKYQAIVVNKTASYTVFLPLAVGMYLGGATKEDVEQVRPLCMKIGEYFQIQDDYLDCFGDPTVTGKVGTDIVDGKCSWFIVEALKLCNPQQLQVLQDNYGQSAPLQQAQVRQVYGELHLEQRYLEYEEAAATELLQLCAQLQHEKNTGAAAVASVLSALVQRLSGRKD